MNILAVLLTLILIPYPSVTASEATSETAQSSTIVKRTINNGNPHKQQKPSQPLTLYQKPTKESKTISTIQEKEDFEVQQGDWLKVTRADGTTGWALASDIQEHIDHAYQNAYQITIHGTSDHYKVKKTSPEKWQKKIESEEKRWKKTMQNVQKWHHQLLSNPWFGIMENDSRTVEELQENVEKLQQEVKKLQGK